MCVLEREDADARREGQVDLLRIRDLRHHLCVCLGVCVRGRERERVCERERESVCERESERESVRERERVKERESV